MKAIKLVFFMLIFSTVSFGQCYSDSLIVTKKSNGKRIAIPQFKKIKIETKTGEKYKGKFKILDDKLVIESDSIDVNEIEKLTIDFLPGRVAGATILGAAAASTIGFGIHGLTSSGWGSLESLGISVLSAVFIPVGTGVLLVSKINYKSKKYSFSFNY
ncbi:MAG: hypothetical protein ACWA41_10245 [Putridiphycobacter sp.]